MEEFFLSRFLAGYEVYVVDQENVDIPVSLPELGRCPCLYGRYKLVCEFLARYVKDFCFRRFCNEDSQC